MTYSLVYASRSTTAVTSLNLIELLAQSRQYNLDNGITGILLYANGCYMQLLEGNEEAVTLLFNRIKKDERHEKVVLLEAGLVAERQFPDWSMAFVDFALPGLTDFLGYSTFLNAPIQFSEMSGPKTDGIRFITIFKASMRLSAHRIEFN